MSINEIKNIAKDFGCHDLVYLNENNSRLLEYLDITKIPEETGLSVDAVAEFQSRPVLYIVFENKARNVESGKIINLQRLLANRGERAFLGFLRPGELEVRPINLDREELKKVAPFKIDSKKPEAPMFFQSIASGTFSMAGMPKSPDFVFESIFDLMTKSSDMLINKFKLFPLDVLSCIGRALFFRFLRDRKIILEKELQELVSPKIESWENCFSNEDNTISVCNWLDDTFNGDLLPFSQGADIFFSHANKETNGNIFLHMQAILLGWEHAAGGSFQLILPLDWNDLNFAHIPIGVLSQVYEKFSRIWDEHQAKETSVYYTPRSIAKYLVEDAFASLPNKKKAKILDPSCGAGIFLVLAFRALVRSHWELDKKRPDTLKIQNILYNQLCGFDISESALRLTALSLYITAIELNNSPRPPQSLKFPKPLQGSVLFNHRKPEEKDVSGFIMGSLRSDLDSKFNSNFDLVIGNPPWSSINEGQIKNQQINGSFTKLTKDILASRGFVELAKDYNNPDNDPDLPFLWSATKWTKTDGIIAMALPSRIFLKQTDAGLQAFSAILKGIEITGILNGSNLADTEVWPDMNQPFMLFWSRNKIPSENHQFYFVTPQFERQLNSKGYLRSDYNAAYPISIKRIIKFPWLLKALSIGTILDVEIIEKSFSRCKQTIASYWKCYNLIHARGYDISPNHKEQKDASHLRKLKNLTPAAHPEKSFCLDINKLPFFSLKTLRFPKNENLYKPPLLIVPKSPGANISSPKSFIAREPIAFCTSYYGFSAHGHPRGNILVSFIHLITHSSLFWYYILMVSPSIGAERRTFLKSDLEKFPIPDFNEFSESQYKRVLQLSKQLENDNEKPWDEINTFIWGLYGLDKTDWQIILDTLSVCWPFKDSRDLACRYPLKDEISSFYSCLKEIISPYFKITKEDIEILPIKLKSNKKASSCPWIFFSILSNSNNFSLSFEDEEKILIDQALTEADRSGCSRVVVRSKGKLLVGILGQYRYWTLSRARLCALHIIRHHLDVFPIGRSE